MSERLSLYVPVAVLTLRNLPVIVYVTLMLPLLNEAVRENAPLCTVIGVWIVVLARNGGWWAGAREMQLFAGEVLDLRPAGRWA